MLPVLQHYVSSQVDIAYLFLELSAIVDGLSRLQ